MKASFFCPKCANRKLEEIVVNVTTTTVIDEIDVDTNGGPSHLIHGEQINEGGQIHRYQCTACGFILRIEDKYRAISTTTELNEWLILHKMGK